VISINIPVFHWRVIVAIGLKDLDKVFKKYKLPANVKKRMSLNAGYCWNISKHETSTILIYSHDTDINVIVHECTHAVHFLMKDLGIPVDIENTELQAYLIAHLTEEIVRRV